MIRIVGLRHYTNYKEEIKVGIEEIAHEIIVELLGLIGQKYSSLNQ